MQLFVLGATGGTDRELIRQVLNAGTCRLRRGNFVHQGGMRKLQKLIAVRIVALASCVSSPPEAGARPILEITTNE
jgi:hypothetical protein